MGSSPEVIIKNAMIITMDENRRIIKNGLIVISDGRIESVGKAESMKGSRAPVEIDATGQIAMPGLINAHCHLGYSLAKGCGDDLPFVRWLPVQSRLQDGYTEEDWRLASLLSMVEMVKSGTTCFADTNVYNQIGCIAKALEEIGVRGVLGKSIADATPEEQAKVPWLKRQFDLEGLSLATAAKDYQEWNGKVNGRLGVAFSPRLWPTCSTGGFKEVAKLGARMGVRKLIHHTESQEWRSFIKHEYGKEPTMMLQDFGILGHDTLLENASSLTEEEASVIASTKTKFNYLPTANMKNYLGVFDLGALQARGVTICIGTSGGLINNTNDMFGEMKTLALQQRMLKHKPDAIAPETILEMATLGGARSLGLEKEIGSLEAGKKADVIVVNANQPHMVPVLDPVSTIVYCANGGDVETTIIDGIVVMRQRRVMTLSEDDILKTTSESAPKILKRIGLLDEYLSGRRWPAS